MNNSIKHLGVVDEVEDGCVKVRIIQTSACATCQAAGHCTASESKEKVVEVYDENLSNLKKGDSVVVVASRRTGFLAVLLSSVLPLLVLVVAMVVTIAIIENEAMAALISIATLIPYYLIIYMLRGKIRTKLSFHIDETGVAV